MRRARSALAISAPVLPVWEQYTTPLAAFHAGKLNAQQMALVLKLPADKQGPTLRWLLGGPEPATGEPTLEEPPPDGKCHGKPGLHHGADEHCPECPAPAPSGPATAPVPLGAPPAPTPARRRRSEARRGPWDAEDSRRFSDAVHAFAEERRASKPLPEPEVDAFGLAAATPTPTHIDVSVPAWERNMNPEQSAVIHHVRGPLRVPAKAGTGKTRALVNRIAYLVRAEGIPGNRIAAFTFSKKAAGEMNKRLDQDLGITSCRVGTWHSLAMQVIKEDKLPQCQWRVDEKDRHKFMVKEAAGYKHVDWKGADLTKLLSFIGWCKAHLWAHDSQEAAQYAEQKFGPAGTRKALAVYKISDELTHGAGLLTFDDMLVFVAHHLSLDCHADEWGAKWDFVLCDEDQDTNIAQKTIRRALAKGHGNLMVVGDKDQSIYGFRGCSPEHFISFGDEWPGAKTVLLNRNYRSGKAIIAAANNVIRPAGGDEDMLAERDHEGKVGVVAAASLDEEASAFVTWVQGHVAEGSVLGSCTALFRTNAQSRALEEKLLSARIPYVIIGGHSFYERREIKDLLAYLRVAMGRDPDGDAVKRCINAPFRFLGARFVDKVMDLANLARGPKNATVWAGIVRDACRQAGIQRRQEASAEEWCDLIAFIQRCLTGNESATDARPATILNELVRATQFIEWLEKEEGEESIESSHGANVRELIRVAERFATCAELLDYIDKSIAEQQKQRKDNEESDGRVTLMSIHRSKGLEWPHVWVVGLCDGVLPHARGDMAEERRLCYVAITRGRDEVVLSWVRNMALKGGVKAMAPSPFLADAGLGDGLPTAVPLGQALADSPKAEQNQRSWDAAMPESGYVPPSGTGDADAVARQLTGLLD